jgi:ParB-like chromosome segregation protein Spo0J
MPALSDAEYADLKADIAARGVMVPVEYDEQGNILDGYHRVKACQELGIKDWPRIIRAGMTEVEKRFHARKLNYARRHLNQEQKQDQIKQQLADTPERSDRQIAVGLGVSPTTVGTARKDMIDEGQLSRLDSCLGADGKERPRQVERKPGAVFAPTAKAQDKAQQVIAAAQGGNETAGQLMEKLARGLTTVTAAAKQVKMLDDKASAIEAIHQLPANVGVYEVIVSDPPWPYSVRVEDPTHRGRPPYPTMSIEEICQMEIPATENCVMWLWTTNYFLHDAFHVLEAWGFAHKTMLTWVKDRMGVGNWLRGQTEHCILAVKGCSRALFLRPDRPARTTLIETGRYFYLIVEGDDSSM